MAIFVGIDEAGFGPLLGPLVVSSSVFSLPHQLLTSDLWQVLNRSVGDRRRGLAGRLLIADSKKAYSKSRGIKELERTVLASLRQFGEAPATLAELLTLLCPSCLERLPDYPWYEDVGSHRLSADGAAVKIASSVFADDLAANGMELLQVRSRCLDVAHYNKMVGHVRNKASVLFTATAGLIAEAFDAFGDDDLQIMIDRQGGRVRYRKILQRMFEGAELAIIRESPATSSYELERDGKRMRLHFAVGADERFLPVSLASMVSKYIRELLIGSINRYFARFSTDLKPTAGYWKDGQRFIRDITTNLPHVHVDNNQLIRCR